MPLLNVTVKKARFVGVQAQQFNSYVTLKLQNVKSTTVTVKGSTPCWEQDFLFETNDINTGLLVEVWSKGMLWDRALGYHYIPLPEVSYTNKDDCGQWMSLDSELEMREGEVVGTKLPTGHTLLLACRFEQPFDPENTRGIDLQRKLEMLNSTMDQEARAEQARRQILYNIGHSGYSEDSDYTSDLNYPIGGQGANSSASQFRTAANQLATPQRSLETSRENSYERDDHHQISSMTVGGRLMVGNYGYGVRNHSPRYDDVYPTTEISSHHRSPPSLQSGESSEPLFYNSRPRHYHKESSRRRKHTWNYDDSQDGWYSEGYDYQQTGLEDARMYSDNEFHSNYTTTLKNKKQVTTYRRPSLERQATLYDEIYFGTDTCMNDPSIQDINAVYRDCKINIKDENYYENIQSYTCQDERNGQDDDEDRQWDSGGQYYIHPSIPDENKRNRKTLPQRPASTIGIHRADYRPTVIRQRSYESEELDQSGGDYRWQKNQQLHHRPMSYEDSSGGGGTGKKLPPTPLKPSNVLLGGRKPFSLPATPGRQLPQTFISSSDESYYKRNYNEDYNYAYQSSQERLQDNYVATVYQNVAETHNGKMHIHNEFLPEYIPEMTDHYSQEYMDSHDTCDDETQLAIDNRYKNDCQETCIHPAATVPPTSGQSIYHDAYQQNTYPKSVKTIHQCGNLQNSDITDNYADAYYNENSVNSYEEHLYESEAFQNIGENSFQQSSFGDSYGQDSSLILYKDDSLSESYPDLYTDRDNYQNKHKKDNNQVLSYDSAVCTTNVHENNIPPSIHNQLHTEQEYDNNYSVPTSSSIYHQQSHTENHDQAVQPTTTQESYENLRNDPQSNFINYHHQDQYNRENTSIECKNDYDQNYTNYANSYDEPYQDESYEQSCVESFNDNINIRQQNEVPPPEVSVTTPKGQTKTNEYQSSASEYYYSLSTVDDHQENTLANSSKRKRPYIQRDTSTLLQQNTDSLESKDDELKDSFETAVSSVNSSQQQKQQLQQYRKGFPGEYSIAGDSSPVAATSIIDSPGSAVVSAVQPTIATTIFNHITSNVSGTTTAMVHSNVTTTTTTTTAIANKKSLTRVESYDEENYQDIEEDDEYLETASNNLQRKDSELSHRSQSSQQSSNQSQKPKLTRGDSYVSDSYDDTYSNRDKRNDDFDDAFNKSTLDRSNSYQKHDLSRGSSAYGKNLTKPQAISRAESYQRGYFKDQGSIDETEIVLSNAINGEYKMRDETLERYERGEEALTRGSRENSLVEPYKVTPPLSRSSSPRGSITKQTSLDESVQMDTPPRSPPEPPADEELLEMVGSAPIPTQLKERPDMTSKQRWHWAYNKIIMQLNIFGGCNDAENRGLL